MNDELISILQRVRREFDQTSLKDFQELVNLIHTILINYDELQTRSKFELHDLLSYISSLELPNDQIMKVKEMENYTQLYYVFTSSRLRSELPYSKDIQKPVKRRP